MRVTGIIAEYDPFHNGHLYMAERARKETGADALVAVMSGCFTQRGMPASLGKRARTEMALAGVDLVIELPFLYACGSAREFAEGAVGILEGTGCVSRLAFGAESADRELLFQAAEAVNDVGDSSGCSRGAEVLRELLHEGRTYASAFSEAVRRLYGDRTAEYLSRPNNLLGVEYTAAIRRMGSEIDPFIIKRKGAEHDQESAVLNFMSGSGIRHMMKRGMTEEIKSFVPASTYDIIIRALSGNDLVDEDRLFIILTYRIMTASAEELSGMNMVTEGLENRIISALAGAGSLDELAEGIKSRRYTMARIRRMLMQILVNVRKTEQEQLKGTRYARVLGFNSKGREVLKEMRKTSRIPVINNIAGSKDEDFRVKKMLEFDGRAAALYELLRSGKNEFDIDKKYIPVNKE